MKQSELVFVPYTARGHIASMLEFANLLLARDHRLSITVLIMKFPLHPNLAAYADSLAKSFLTERIHFIDITQSVTFTAETNYMVCLDLFIEKHKPHVKTAVSELIRSNRRGTSLAGFVVDLAFTTLVDVANEFGVPTYAFWSSTASWLGLNLHLQALQDEKYHGDLTELKNGVLASASRAELIVPGFVNPVPASVVPSVVFDKEASDVIMNCARRLRLTKGIVVNTFMELESHAIGSIFPCGESPPVYSVGPLLNLTGDGADAFSLDGTTDDQIINWLDDQPPLSVIFLCFGSMGSFGVDQLKEIGSALERTGFRFLWCIRHSFLSDNYVDPKQVLPEGFLDRTAKIGKVINWAPQVAVLSHPAVGGFVSHCGWNSLLESLWFGVPVATWPLFAEQQLNAFEMVRELELAVEIKIDYKWGFGTESVLVSAQEIEIGIRRVMEGDQSDIRKSVKEMSEKSRKAVMEGGSSYSSLGRFICNVFDNFQ
ncbi:UDP-glucuronosyl/UDP-glucosyltransferase [Trema orientale]|uniref:Glycosyltransferase n=1 Tax=Trema orientale TaxID=63057 RepID=A0A2P5FKC8_TREOI|nr:UDP-glucuronosyl/UDP-glucosyltransferase [Trema orientale]